MAVIRTLAGRIKGFSAKGFLPTRESGVHALKLESGSEILIILWRQRAGEFQEPEAKDTLTVAYGARPKGAWDMFGKPMALPEETGGTTAFRAGLDPLYLVFPNPGSASNPVPPRKDLRRPASIRGWFFDRVGNLWSATGKLMAS